MSGHEELRSPSSAAQPEPGSRVARGEVATSDTVAAARSLLDATLESTADGLLVVDRHGRMVTFNRKFADIWRMPPDVLESRDDDRALSVALAQLKDAATFLARVKYLYAHPEEESVELIELRDGRFIERYSIPQRIDGVCVGRVWSFRDVTDRHRTESALRDSEKKVRDLVSQAPVGIYQADRDGRMVTANAALARLLGYTSEELLSRSMVEELFVDAQDRDLALTRSGPIGRGAEVRLRRKDGSTFWAHVFTHSVKNVEGKTLYYEGFVLDLSDRKRAERLQDLRFAVARTLAESSSLGDAGSAVLRILGEALGYEAAALWKVERGSGLLRAAGFWQQLGVPAHAVEASSRGVPLRLGEGPAGRVLLSGEPLWVTRVTVETLALRFEAAAAAGFEGVCAFPLVSDGEIVGAIELFSRKRTPPEMDLVPVVSELGGQIGQFVKRRETEDAQRVLEVRYRNLLERNPAGVYRVTRGGRLLECNESFARILGYGSRMELLTQNVSELYEDPRDREELLAGLQRDGFVVNAETRLKRRDGTPAWVLENISVVWDQDGDVLEGTLIDVTDRKLLEEQLRQSQKMEAVGRLAGGIAHDFNNLLTAILGFSDLVLSQLGPDDALRPNVEEVRRAGEQAATLTRQLLAFSRRQLVSPVVLDLNRAILGMEKMLRRLIGEDVEVLVALETDLGRVKADAGQVEQVIVNLVVNARDAMPTGGRLVIETRNVELDEAYAHDHMNVKSGTYVLLSVSDSGMGMDAETKSRLFEPFFTTKERARGTGLGLPTVYGIVKQSGGHIWVYSEPGAGTTFKIYLPRVTGEEELENGAAAVHSEPRGGTETVLVAENEEAVRRFVCEALTRRGYFVLAAANGAEALEVAASHGGCIDLLVTDVLMPVMGGRDLATRLIYGRPEVQVLYISGFAEGAIVKNGVLPRETAFLAKPFTQEALLRKVRELLETRS